MFVILRGLAEAFAFQLHVCNTQFGLHEDFREEAEKLLFLLLNF